MQIVCSSKWMQNLDCELWFLVTIYNQHRTGMGVPPQNGLFCGHGLENILYTSLKQIPIIAESIFQRVHATDQYDDG